MKFAATFKCAYENESRPARGGWIEIRARQSATRSAVSRPAMGGWTEIPTWPARTPVRRSRPARGGWIEIGVPQWTRLHSRSRPARGGWIEIGPVRPPSPAGLSRPAWGGITIFWQVFSCNVRHRISETAHYKIWTAAGICRGPESYFMLRS